MDRKGSIYFIFFKSSKHETIVLHALRNYLRNMWNPAKQQSDCKAMTFCGTFRKNVARTECATHHERLYNACVWLKKIHLQRISPKCQKFSWVISRSSRPEVFVEISALENFAKFTRKSPLLESLLNKVAVLQSPALFKKRLKHRRFPMNFEKFWRTPLGDCMGFHHFKRGFSLYISFCKIP